MKTREELTDIFNDTERFINSEPEHYEKLNKLKSEKFTIWKQNEKILENLKNSSVLPVMGLPGEIAVLNVDCVAAARHLATEKTCMLNMASHSRPGGAVRSGSRAQEEELCRRSNLIAGLELNGNSDLYPLNEEQYLYTKNVTFFKDGYYQMLDKFFECDIITIPAINLNRDKDEDFFKGGDYEKLMSQKVEAMLIAPYLNGCKNLVLSAFGCGVFKNDPKFVAGLFKKYLIDLNYRHFYKTIVFAIINDSNALNDNFNAFKDALELKETDGVSYTLPYSG